MDPPARWKTVTRGWVAEGIAPQELLMGLTCSFGDEYVTVHADGSFGLDEIRRTFEHVREQSPGAAPVRILIVDAGSSFAPTPQEVRAFVDDWSEVFSGRGACISLAVSRDLHFGLGRMAAVVAEGHDLPMRVFRGEKQAVEWLLAAVPQPSN
jgi:hypothetical protein